MSQVEKQWSKLSRCEFIVRNTETVGGIEVAVDSPKVLHYTSKLEDILAVHGPGYPKGYDLGSKFRGVLKKNILGEYRPPIFSQNPDQDLGVAKGFAAALGVAPMAAKGPLEHLEVVVNEVLPELLSMHGLIANLAEVADVSELWPCESSFMTGKLPGVRLLLRSRQQIIMPDNTSIFTDIHPSNPQWAPHVLVPLAS